MNTRTAFLVGLNLAGIISVSTIFVKEPYAPPIRIARVCFLAAGAIAGGVLLNEYRTPSKIEKQAKAVDQAKEDLETERARLHDEIAKARQSDIEVNQELQAEMQRFLEEQKRSFEEQYNNLQEISQQEINQLYRQLEIANLPKIPVGIKPVHIITRQVMEVMQEYGAYCDFEDAQLSSHGFLLWLSPRQGITLDKCKKSLENLPMRLKGLYGVPQLTAADGCIEISMPIESERQRTIIADESKGQKGIKPEPADWFSRVIIETHHYFISGKTGSGKSVLMNNIACFALKTLKELSGKSPEIVIIDPKFGQSSAWEFHGKRIIPQYQNYNPSIVHKTFKGNAIEGVLEMGKLTRKRLEEGAAAARDNIVLEEENSVFFLIDEAADLFSLPDSYLEQVYLENELDLPDDHDSGKALGTAMKASLKTTLRLGRSEKVKSMIVGQSDLVSSYDLNKPDLLNCTMFFLGQNALRGIDIVATDRQNKKELREQLSLYQERAETDDRYKYYCLVSTHFCKPFIALMPPENHFSDLNFWGSEGFTERSQRVQEAVEPLSSRSEPTKGSYSELKNLDLTDKDLKGLEYCILQGRNQDDSILQVLGVRKGGSKRYANGKTAYKHIKSVLQGEKTELTDPLEAMVLANFESDNPE